ncbi:hypothetical protein scyTo_0001339 [Scyliorhinus torazame]|uniref:N-acetyltransferase domain-containing protein n=1 Tax=Scyliorhinus torazame TaxID=75743 RepID=A0A401PC17_SCYTO|nr:hypothetical protein [Scyliorhinus torazame]
MTKFMIRNATSADCADLLRLIKELASYENMANAVKLTEKGLGIGSEILKRISQIAIQNRCCSMHFLVVGWNKASIEYYTKRGARDLSKQEGWHLFKFSKENMIKLASEE